MPLITVRVNTWIDAANTRTECRQLHKPDGVSE